MNRSIIFAMSCLFFLPGAVFAQLAYSGYSLPEEYKGAVTVNISTTVYDSWDVTGDVELGETTWNDLSQAPTMNMLHLDADASTTARLIEELEALEMQEMQLASFSAGREVDHIFLDWSAGVNQNILRYFIQRSGDGENWEDIGMLRIPSAPSPLEDYSYIDNHPIAGSNFYRLKQENKSGTISYSDVVAVEMLETGSHTMHLFPNPAIFGASIDLNLQAVVPVYISLLDAEEHTIVTIFSDQTSIGRHTVELDLDELPKGKYTCLIEVGETLAERFLEK